MSRLSTRKLLAAGLMLAIAPWATAQDPVPIGYTSYKYQPAWGVPQMPAFIAQPMPYPYPQSPVQQTANYRGQHSLPPAAPPSLPPAAPPVGHATSGCNTGSCNSHSLFDGSHLASLKAWLASHHPHRHPRGPLTIDSLPTHPYARSPRDFFMFYENLEAERSRDLRPALIP